MNNRPALDRLKNNEKSVWEIYLCNMVNILWKCRTKCSRDQWNASWREGLSLSVNVFGKKDWGDSADEGNQVKRKRSQKPSAIHKFFVLWDLRKQEKLPVDIFLKEVQKHLTLCVNTGLLLFLLSIWEEFWRCSSSSWHALQVICMHGEVEKLLGTSKMKIFPLLLGEGAKRKVQERALLLLTYIFIDYNLSPYPQINKFIKDNSIY